MYNQILKVTNWIILFIMPNITIVNNMNISYIPCSCKDLRMYYSIGLKVL